MCFDKDKQFRCIFLQFQIKVLLLGMLSSSYLKQTGSFSVSNRHQLPFSGFCSVVSLNPLAKYVNKSQVAATCNAALPECVCVCGWGGSLCERCYEEECRVTVWGFRWYLSRRVWSEVRWRGSGPTRLLVRWLGVCGGLKAAWRGRCKVMWWHSDKKIKESLTVKTWNLELDTQSVVPEFLKRK